MMASRESPASTSSEVRSARRRAFGVDPDGFVDLCLCCGGVFERHDELIVGDEVDLVEIDP